jgi:hypothetical protein
MATIEQLEERIAELEARAGVGVQPLAANPPITIGELNDVPAPGSPIASQWSQEVTRRAVHRFADVAQRDSLYAAASAGNGAICITLDTGTVWRVVSGAWRPVSPSVGGFYGINHYHAVLATNTNAPQTTAVPVLTIAMPAAPAGSLLDMSLTAYINSAAGHGGGFLSFRVNGVIAGPTVVVPDIAWLGSLSGRCVNVAQPVGIAYNIDMMAAKAAAGGNVILTSTNTVLSIVSYRP